MSRRSFKRDEAVALARKAVQTAHDARLIAEKRTGEQRAALAESTVLARAEAAEQRARAAESESRRAAADRIAAERARVEANLTAQRTQVQLQYLETEAAALKAEMHERLGRMNELEETARGLVLTLPDVQFEVGSAKLNPGGRETLATLAAILVAHPNIQVEVVGHTDNLGEYVHNQDLSERRAREVFEYLFANGADIAQVYAYGLGETEPIATNRTVLGRHLNRRVEITIAGEPLGYAVSWLR